jgi:hypothetical protein
LYLLIIPNAWIADVELQERVPVGCRPECGWNSVWRVLR